MNAKIVMEHEEKIEARINKFIEPQLTKKKMLWYFINFSQIIPKENVQRSFGRIYLQILGVKGLKSQSGKLLSEKKKVVQILVLWKFQATIYKPEPSNRMVFLVPVINFFQRAINWRIIASAMMTNSVKKEGKKVIMDGIMDYLAKGRLQE